VTKLVQITDLQTPELISFVHRTAEMALFQWHVIVYEQSRQPTGIKGHIANIFNSE